MESELSIMATSIYATFATEGAAERATGALLDHGVGPQDVSFVISDPVTQPTVFHPQSESARQSAPVDAAPPASRPLPGTHPVAHSAAVPSSALARDVAPDLYAAPADSLQDAPGSVYDRPAVAATVLPPNTPQEIVDHERRPHIIDMESNRPRAADGISTTTAGDAAKGAIGGAGIGVGLGILLGIAAVMIPGVGLVAGAGSLVAALAAATGVAGGVAGGVTGYLADLGVPPHSARLLSDHLDGGGVVLHIEVSGTLGENEIVQILSKYGATSAQAF